MGGTILKLTLFFGGVFFWPDCLRSHKMFYLFVLYYCPLCLPGTWMYLWFWRRHISDSIAVGGLLSYENTLTAEAAGQLDGDEALVLLVSRRPLSHSPTGLICHLQLGKTSSTDCGEGRKKKTQAESVGIKYHVWASARLDAPRIEAEFVWVGFEAGWHRVCRGLARLGQGAAWLGLLLLLVFSRSQERDGNRHHTSSPR